MSPAAIAMTAGAIGSICGALFVAVLAMPSTQDSGVMQNRPMETTAAATPAQVEQQAVKAEAQPAAVPDAAKAASVEDDSEQAATECDRQTWPYITQRCLTERSADGQRRVRVITTDRIAAPVVDAIETSREPPSAKVEERQNTKAKAPVAVVPPAPAKAAAANPEQTPETKATPAADASAPSAQAPQAAPQKQGTIAAATPPPAAAAAPAPAPAPAAAVEPKPQHASAKEERGKKARDKRKREVKSRRVPPPTSADDDDGSEDSNPRTVRAADRDDSRTTRGRVVERWTEREYEVPSYNGSQRRRVIVIRRNGDRADAYMPSAGNYSRSVFGY